MPLVIGLVALVGAVLLLTSGVTDASFADVITGKAGAIYRKNATPATGGGTGAGSAGTSSVAPGKSGGVNPFSLAKGFIAGRTDQGVDADMQAGSPILAPFNSQYLGTISNWFEGQPYIAFKITSGAYAGKVYYLAEQIVPGAFSPGQTVNAGQQIATYASSGTGIEMGLANPSNWAQTLAQATTGYTEGEATQAGQEWRSILQSLGAL